MGIGLTAWKDLRGYWELNLIQEQTKGTGKTVFIRYKDFEPGEEKEIEGRQVRVVQGVTIERMSLKPISDNENLHQCPPSSELSERRRIARLPRSKSIALGALSG